MDWSLQVRESLIKEINLCKTELQFYVNLEFDNENDKLNKIKTLLEKIVLKEQCLEKWCKITDFKIEEK